MPEGTPSTTSYGREVGSKKKATKTNQPPFSIYLIITLYP